MFDKNYYINKQQVLLQRYNKRREEFANAVINMGKEHEREIKEILAEYQEIEKAFKEGSEEETLVEKKKNAK